MFSTLYGTYFIFQIHFKMTSAICFNLDQSKIFLPGNGLNYQWEQIVYRPTYMEDCVYYDKFVHFLANYCPSTSFNILETKIHESNNRKHFCCCSKQAYMTKYICKQEGHDGPRVAHLSLLTKHNQFPTSCEIYVLPNNKILNSSV